MISLPLVALTMTASAAPSPAEPPIVPARSTFTGHIGARESFTVSVGAAERIEVDGSTSLRSMTMLPRCG